MKKLSKRKIFFALLPKKSCCNDILKLQSKFDKDIGRWIQPNNIHITLMFVGYVDNAQLECVLNAAKAITVEHVKIDLDVLGRFKKSEVLWLGSEQPHAQLQYLYDALVENIKECGVQLEQRKFHPHVTLARKVKKKIKAPDFREIKWFSDHFYLMESIQVEAGVEYKVLAEYKMR